MIVAKGLAAVCTLVEKVGPANAKDILPWTDLTEGALRQHLFHGREKGLLKIDSHKRPNLWSVTDKWLRTHSTLARFIKPERQPVWPGKQNFAPSVSCVGMGTAVPKRAYIRSKALLAAVRTLPCQHSGVTGRTEAAHSNWPQHGKAKSIKADDNRVAALSAEVHRELDQGKNWSAAERQAIWWAAHCKTVRALLAAGLWPANVPIPDLRSFDA